MANWNQNHDLVYAFVCVSFLADGEVNESEKEAMRGNCKVVTPEMSDDEYSAIEDEAFKKFDELGDKAARLTQYTKSLEAIKEKFTSDEDRFKLIKNLAYIARANKSIHENEKSMIEDAVSILEMTNKINLEITESNLFVDFKG